MGNPQWMEIWILSQQMVDFKVFYAGTMAASVLNCTYFQVFTHQLVLWFISHVRVWTSLGIDRGCLVAHCLSIWYSIELSGSGSLLFKACYQMLHHTYGKHLRVAPRTASECLPSTKTRTAIPAKLLLLTLVLEVPLTIFLCILRWKYLTAVLYILCDKSSIWLERMW